MLLVALLAHFTYDARRIPEIDGKTNQKLKNGSFLIRSAVKTRVTRGKKLREIIVFPIEFAAISITLKKFLQFKTQSLIEIKIFGCFIYNCTNFAQARFRGFAYLSRINVHVYVLLRDEDA